MKYIAEFYINILSVQMKFCQSNPSDWHFSGIILAAAMYERILSLISIEWENLKINERISLCFHNNFISTWFTLL